MPYRSSSNFISSSSSSTTRSLSPLFPQSSSLESSSATSLLPSLSSSSSSITTCPSTTTSLEVDKGPRLKRFKVLTVSWTHSIFSFPKSSNSSSASSWVSSFWLSEGDYEYVDVMMKDKNNVKVTRLIVDMDFRSQFELARPTQNYKPLKDTLPTIFVGTEEKLDKIISLLCPAAKQSLKDNGLRVPPWRKAKYMQSKWLSKDCKKVSINMETGIMDHKSEPQFTTTH